MKHSFMLGISNIHYSIETLMNFAFCTTSNLNNSWIEIYFTVYLQMIFWFLQMISGILNSWVKFCCMLTQCSYCYFDSWGLKKRMKTYLHQTNESWQKERWRDKDIKYQKWFQSKENCSTGSEIFITIKSDKSFTIL